MCDSSKLWAWGHGQYGCLYDHAEGPYESAAEAARAACELFELGPGSVARLRREGVLDVSRRALGTDYLELFRVGPDWDAMESAEGAP